MEKKAAPSPQVFTSPQAQEKKASPSFINSSPPPSSQPEKKSVPYTIVEKRSFSSSLSSSAPTEKRSFPSGSLQQQTPSSPPMMSLSEKQVEKETSPISTASPLKPSITVERGKVAGTKASFENIGKDPQNSGEKKPIIASKAVETKKLFEPKENGEIKRLQNSFLERDRREGAGEQTPPVFRRRFLTDGAKSTSVTTSDAKESVPIDKAIPSTEDIGSDERKEPIVVHKENERKDCQEIEEKKDIIDIKKEQDPEGNEINIMEPDSSTEVKSDERDQPSEIQQPLPNSSKEGNADIEAQLAAVEEQQQLAAREEYCVKSDVLDNSDLPLHLEVEKEREKNEKYKDADRESRGKEENWEDLKQHRYASRSSTVQFFEAVSAGVSTGAIPPISPLLTQREMERERRERKAEKEKRKKERDEALSREKKTTRTPPLKLQNLNEKKERGIVLHSPKKKISSLTPPSSPTRESSPEDLSVMMQGNERGEDSHKLQEDEERELDKKAIVPEDVEIKKEAMGDKEEGVQKEHSSDSPFNAERKDMSKTGTGMKKFFADFVKDYFEQKENKFKDKKKKDKKYEVGSLRKKLGSSKSSDRLAEISTNTPSREEPLTETDGTCKYYS